jgi:hypothetical protein
MECHKVQGERKVPSRRLMEVSVGLPFTDWNRVNTVLFFLLFQYKKSIISQDILEFSLQKGGLVTFGTVIFNCLLIFL